MRKTSWTYAIAAGLLVLSQNHAHADPANTQEIHIPMEAEPESLDPHKFSGLNEFRIAINLFEGLVTLSAAGTPVPGVAQTWDQSKDGLIWTFHLRADAKWSNGDPVTAGDFVYSFRRAVSPATASPYAAALDCIAGAKEIIAGRQKDVTRLGAVAVDPRTLRVTLAQPTPWFLSLLVNQIAMPVPRKTIEKYGDAWVRPGKIVDNGPYLIESWIPHGEIVLVKSKTFHDAAQVQVEHVRHILADDGEAALKRYLAGELDVVGVPGRHLQDIEQQRPAELRIEPMLGNSFFMVNMDGDLGRDPRLRQALSMVIDREVLLRKVDRSRQIAAYGLVPDGIPGYTQQQPDWAAKPMPERIALAKKLFAEARGGDTTPLKIKITFTKDENARRHLLAVAAMWKAALGVEVEQDTSEWRVFESKLSQHDFEMANYGWVADYVDPWTFLSIFRTDAQEMNPGNYRNPAFDQLLDRARTTLETAPRMALLEQAERLLIADQPAIPISFWVGQTLVSPRLRGYAHSPLGIHPDRYLSLAP